MNKKIPLGLLVDMMKASGDSLEIIDEGDSIRVKGMFSIKIQDLKGGKNGK